MPATIQVQVIIPRDTGLPEDVTVNTFHFDNNAATDAAAAAEIAAKIEAFYNGTASGQTLGVDKCLSPLNGNPVQLRFYDALALDPGGPFATASFTLDNPGTGQQVEEAAICLSYRADTEVGIPAARLRGRIFLGPLSGECLSVTAGRAYVGHPYLDAITASAKEFLMDDEENTPWVVFSRGKGTLSLENPEGTPNWTPFHREVTTVWADDAFDTIRSRGSKPSTRFTKTKA